MLTGVFFFNVKCGKQCWKVLNIEIDNNFFKWVLKKYYEFSMNIW